MIHGEVDQVEYVVTVLGLVFDVDKSLELVLPVFGEEELLPFRHAPGFMVREKERERERERVRERERARVRVRERVRMRVRGEGEGRK